MEVLFEDDCIIVINKKHGVASQPDKTGAENMVSILQDYTKSEFIGVVHRLDRPVSGVMVYAKTKMVCKKLCEEVANKKLKKEYLAVVCGKAKDEESLTDFLIKNERLNISKVVHKNNKGAKEAKLIYKKEDIIVNKDNEKLYLLKINLLTGRHHQIRVQLSSNGLPIWGDTKYNPLFSRPNKPVRLALFSHKISFTHPKTNKIVEFCATEDFSFCLE